MDKRDLSNLFAERLRQLCERDPRGVSGLARATAIDRSALSGFLAPGSTRLPRLEALRRIAEEGGVSTDWLLGLSYAEEGARELAPAIEIEEAVSLDGETPIARWHREAAGHKVRYVPSQLPDHLCLPEIFGPAEGPGRRAQAEAAALTIERGETDVEIALPIERLQRLAEGVGGYRRLDRSLRRAQLAHMARLADEHYPLLRLHLYDGETTYSAPFTVFGQLRAALYLGPAYLVLTAAEDVRRLARIFDGLVRAASVTADRAAEALETMAREAR